MAPRLWKPLALNGCTRRRGEGIQSGLVWRRAQSPEKAYSEIVKLLLKNGADVNYINISFDGLKSTGMTALDTAKGTWDEDPRG